VARADIVPEPVKGMSDQPDSKYWRSRADEAFAMAENMVSEDGKAWMLEIARLYNRLADKAAKREAKNKGE
jgi:hypothetical protein